MSRIVNRKVTVTSNDLGEPLTVVDGDSRCTVSRIIDHWREAGAWWDNEPARTIYRVETVDSFVFDLERADTGEWAIYRVWD